MARLLTQRDLQPLFADPGALEDGFASIEASFSEHQRGEAASYSSLALPLEGPRDVLRVVPARSLANGASVRVNPQIAGDHPPVDAHVNLLFDNRNGQLLALLAGDDLNVYRTGIPSGIGVRYLAPSDARTVALLGSGRQARGQIAAIHHALPSIDAVRVYSPTPEHRVAFALEMSNRLGLRVQAIDSPEDAVRGADVVGITSNAREPVLEADWVQPGALVVSIANAQLPPELIMRARVIASARSSFAVEARREPYSSLAASGTWGPERLVGEMADVIAGVVQARKSPGDVVVLELVGLSAWDAAALNWAYRWAEANDVGEVFHLSLA
jgi:ornithine cyclodeaminase/alanine dehydrogenase-like protein (mu-crystallin family)